MIDLIDGVNGSVRGNNLIAGLPYQAVGLFLSGSLAFKVNYVDAAWTLVP